MRGRVLWQEGEQDFLDTQGVLHANASQKTMKKGEEIKVFDAGRYFAGAENLRMRSKEMEDELDDEAQPAADADGNLPLSPLPEFYISGKARHMHTRQNHNVLAGRVAPVQRQLASNISPHGAPLQSPTSSNPRMRESSLDATHGKGIHSGSKPQAFSPSMRIASFLARFKLSSESKSKQQSTTTVAAAAVPTTRTSTSSGQQATTPPKSSFFSNASSLPSNSKPPSPRGRFLRALSSSSSQNSLLKPISHMRHHGAIAASTPVSPAGSDPYSPTTHSASTTPNSRKNPRSRPRSHVPTSPASVDWRRDVDDVGNRSNGLSAHLPFIRRKLRAYLMPEKLPKQHQEGNHQQATRSKQERRASNHDHVINGTHIASDKQPVSSTRMAPNHVAPNTSNGNTEKQRQSGNRATEKPAPVVEKIMLGEAILAQGRLDRAQHRGNSIRSPAHRAAATATVRTDPSKLPSISSPSKLSSMKEMRRRGDSRAHRQMAGDQADVDDDIEVAERLLRVVKEHQNAAISTHQPAYTASYNNKTNNNNINMKGGMNRHGFGEQGSGLVAENGGTTRRSRKSSSISPFSSPARYSSKEEYACPYDSDSSSDLFEIETSLHAFSHAGGGLYRPRELPVYDTPLTKSPLHITKSSK